MAIVMNAGIGGKDTFVGLVAFSSLRAIIAWRCRPRSHGIFVSHLFASSIVLSIQRLLVPIVLLLMFAVLIGGVEVILRGEGGKNLTIKFFFQKIVQFFGRIWQMLGKPSKTKEICKV